MASATGGPNASAILKEIVTNGLVVVVLPCSSKFCGKTVVLLVNSCIGHV